MTAFFVFARTASGASIGRLKIEFDTDLPLEEGDVLTLEDATDEVGF